MTVAICLIGIYIIAFIADRVMRTINPDSRWYSLWVLFVCIAITVFLIWYELLNQGH